MTSSKIQNGRKLEHIQTMCQICLSTTEPNKTLSKVKMSVHHSAYSSAASSHTNSKSIRSNNDNENDYNDNSK